MVVTVLAVFLVVIVLFALILCHRRRRQQVNLQQLQTPDMTPETSSVAMTDPGNLKHDYRLIRFLLIHLQILSSFNHKLCSHGLLATQPFLVSSRNASPPSSSCGEKCCVTNTKTGCVAYPEGGGHLGIFWVGMCPSGLQIGTPFYKNFP